MEIHREAELILNNRISASAGWLIEGTMGYVGASHRHLQYINVHGTPRDGYMSLILFVVNIQGFKHLIFAKNIHAGLFSRDSPDI